MTIHNIYFVAGCALWLLILLWLSVKLAADSLRRSIRSRKQKRIARFFYRDSESEEAGTEVRRLIRYSEDEQLMGYICACYADTAECSRNRQLMASMLDRKIDRLPRDDRDGRRRLVSEIDFCHISTHRIDGFLEDYERDFPGEFSRSEGIRLTMAR